MANTTRSLLYRIVRLHLSVLLCEALPNQLTRSINADAPALTSRKRRSLRNRRGVVHWRAQISIKCAEREVLISTQTVRSK